MEEGLFYPDDLSSDQLSILQDYVRTHRADTVKRRPLKFLTLREFLKKFFTASYKDRCLVVGFNLPFDLSRLAFDAGAARFSRRILAGSLDLFRQRHRIGNFRQQSTTSRHQAPRFQTGADQLPKEDDAGYR